MKAFKIALVAVLFGAAAGAVEFPQVAEVKPFSQEANFMSLPGYVRLLVWEQQGVWLSREEAVAAVDTQIEAASR